MAGGLQLAGWMNLADLISRVSGPMLTGVLGVALVVPTAAVYGAVEARSLRVKSDTVASASLPPELDGLRIVYLADVHAGPYFGPSRMDDLVRRVNALDADVLILGGDYVGGRSNGAEIFYPRASELKARVAKLAVLGNHDNWEGSAQAKRGLTDAGFTVLENDNARVTVDGASLYIAGVDDLYTGHPDPEAAAGGIPEGAFSVLVSHNPDVFADDLGTTAGTWALALAGHTHGGQVAIGSVGYVPSRHGARYRTGWRTENGTRILVTNGVGSVTVPLRISAEPEIHLITLQSR